MSAWMVTRKNDQEWIVIDILSNPYGLSSRDVCDWNTSIYFRRIADEEELVVPGIHKRPFHSQVLGSAMLEVQNCAGAPLYTVDGDVWGTLTGLNQTPLPASAVPSKLHLRSCADLIMQVYETELKILRIERRALEVTTRGWRDSETGAFNQKAYDFDIRSANQLAQTHMIPGGVIVVDHGWSSREAQKVVREISRAHPNKCRSYTLEQNKLVILMTNVYEPVQHAILDSIQKVAPVAHYGYAPRLHRMAFEDAHAKAERLANLLKVA